MKSIIAMVLSVILSTFTMSLFAGEDYYFARDDEELYGTWINLHYGTNPPQKLVYNPNGTGTPPHWLTGALDRITFAKETFSSPKFTGYPLDCMPCSQTPVVF